MYINSKINDKIKPKLAIKVFQILQGQSKDFHFLFYFLNLARESLFLILVGICS